MTVIEGPVDNFVAPGDFVLSTGLDQGAERLGELVAGVNESGGAALVIAVGDDAPVASVPDDARALADRHASPSSSCRGRSASPTSCAP